jgi:toxin ParE1/3/4
MPPFELHYRPTALADLEDTFRSVLRVSANPITARRYIARIRERCRRITILPLAGRPRDGLDAVSRQRTARMPRVRIEATRGRGLY